MPLQAVSSSFIPAPCLSTLLTFLFKQFLSFTCSCSLHTRSGDPPLGSPRTSPSPLGVEELHSYSYTLKQLAVQGCLLCHGFRDRAAMWQPHCLQQGGLRGGLGESGQRGLWMRVPGQAQEVEDGLCGEMLPVPAARPRRREVMPALLQHCNLACMCVLNLISRGVSSSCCWAR